MSVGSPVGNVLRRFVSLNVLVMPGFITVANRCSMIPVEVEGSRYWNNKKPVEALIADFRSRKAFVGTAMMGEAFRRISWKAEDTYARDFSSLGGESAVIHMQSFHQGKSTSGTQDVIIEEEFYLEGVGQVTATLLRDSLGWQLIDSDDDLVGTCCWGRRKEENPPRRVLISEVYAAEVMSISDPFPVGLCEVLAKSKPTSQMFRFAVHTFGRSQSNKCNWIPKVHIFFHENADICQSWVRHIQGLLDRDGCRPKNLLVLVNPYGGKRDGVQRWEAVAPLFERARVRTKVIFTERAGHAYDLMAKSTDEDLKMQDGIVVVGGDGLFNEVLNGLVMNRHEGHPAPKPQEVSQMRSNASKSHSKVNNDNPRGTCALEALRSPSIVGMNLDLHSKSPFDDRFPLLETSISPGVTQTRAQSCGSATNSSTFTSNSSSQRYSMDQDSTVYAVSGTEIELLKMESIASSVSATTSGIGRYDTAGEFLFPEAAVTESGDEAALPTVGGRSLTNSSPQLRIGIIPAGSTDTVAMSTTGSRSAITAALHILLGDSMPLDIVKVTGWKRTAQSGEETPRVRYAASFAGYGFYGDVMKDSENLRWLGPARYDIAGIMVFLKHKKYKAEVSFLDMLQETSGKESKGSKREQTVICRVNCGICAQGFDLNHLIEDKDQKEVNIDELQQQKPKWRTIRGSFHNVGGAVMSCRNDKAPDGLSAHAHLADGLLHLILIRPCSRPSYLRQLITLTRRGADPLDFDFVEHHKTPAFTFTSLGEESVWNIDGELFPAHQLSAQVCRGLVNVFARGPEF